MNCKRLCVPLVLLLVAACARPPAPPPPPPPAPPPPPPPPPAMLQEAIIDHERHAIWHHVFGGPVTDEQYRGDREACDRATRAEAPASEDAYWWAYFLCLRRKGYEPDSAPPSGR